MIRILAVDDDPVACDLLKESLTVEGFAVTVAANGFEALEQIQRESFHLLITDFAMPDLDGLALLTEAKRLFPRLQVILMTASREEGVLNEAIRRGAYVVIAKPLGQAEILKIVKEVLRDQRVVPSESKPLKPAKLKM